MERKAWGAKGGPPELLISLSKYKNNRCVGLCARLARICANASAVSAINNTATPSKTTLSRREECCNTTTRLRSTLRTAPMENTSSEHWPVRIRTVAGHQLRMELSDLI